MMETKIQIKSIGGLILFEYEKENNVIKDTVIEAIKRRGNLRGANLRGADLEGANLGGANLRGANLEGANLERAHLEEANLRVADLEGAHLEGANLRGADLEGANLGGANLRGADLEGANLRVANLERAHLEEANLGGANLRGANLERANLEEANLRGLSIIHSIIPDGELIVWKKLKHGLIAKLKIAKEARRVNAIGSRKCRFEYAEVIAIYEGKKNVKEGVGIYDNNLIYHVGKTVYPDKFDPDPRIECSHGIHAFITRLEAEEYN